MPIGHNGAIGLVESGTTCRCGREWREDGERCTAGHVRKGNGLATVTGARSTQFWEAHREAAAALVAAVVSDAGYDPASAPRALLEAAAGLAQAVLVRDSAFLRMTEEGGALTSAGRGRRCLQVWVQAQSAVERHLRLLGLRRVPKPVDPLEAVRRAVEEANAR